MGCVKNISYESFPKQGLYVGKPVNVCFNYDTTKCLPGVIVRDDYEEPWLGIIALEDGRYVLTTECQYSIVRMCNNGT